MARTKASRLLAIKNIFPGATLRPTDYYGYPNVSSPRRIKPTILGVIHGTDGYNIPKPGATKSWTFVVDRNGSIYQFLDPITQTPWTNGDVKTPDLTNPLVKAAARSGYNFNEFCFLTIENVCYISGGERLTSAQLAADHRILEWGSKLSGLPLDRAHVIGHYQVNSETRNNCPTVPADRTRVFNGVINGISLPDTDIASQEFNMHLRPKADLWRMHANAPYWIDGPDPSYNGTDKSWAVEPTGNLAGTPDGVEDITLLEEWRKGSDGTWTSGDWRLLLPARDDPKHTSGMWVFRSDMDPIRKGGALAYDDLMKDALYGTVYDPAADKIVSVDISALPPAPAPDCSSAVAAATAPLNDKIEKQANIIAGYKGDLAKANADVLTLRERVAKMEAGLDAAISVQKAEAALPAQLEAAKAA